MKRSSVAHWRTWNLPLSTAIVIVTILGLAPLLGLVLAAEGWWIEWKLGVNRVVVVGVLSLALAIPVVIRWPVVSTLGLYAFLVPFDSVAALTGGDSWTLTKLIGLVAAGVLAATGLMERRLRRPPWAALWWGLLVLWAALSATWALDRSLVFERLPTALSLFLLYLVAVSIRPSRKEFFTACVLAVLGGLLAAGIVYFSTDTTRSGVRGTLVLGTREANPNNVAAALMLPFALAIGGYVGLRGVLPKVAAMTAVGLIGVGVYVTGSRKAVLAVVVMIVIFLYRFRERRQILVAVAVLLALTAAMPQAITDRFAAVFTGKDTTGSGRTEIWQVGITALERFGTFGAGLSNYTAVYNITASHGPRLGPRASHNTYLEAWVELGIVGLVLILGALVSHLWAVHRTRAQGADQVMLGAIEGACLGMLVIAFFGDILWSKGFWLVWILLTWATYTGVGTDHQEF